jgi:CheY-like chemotaxis protein
MPEMTGLDVVRSLRGEGSHTQIVVTSGYMDLAAEKEYRRLDQDISIIPKPYHLSDITLALSA